MSSVRGEIIGAIFERLAAIDGVHAVVDDGEVDAVTDCPEDRAVLEVACFDDEAAGEPKTIEAWEMPVTVLIHLPATRPPGDEEEAPPSWAQVAAAWTERVYAAYAADGADGQWDGLAVETRCDVKTTRVIPWEGRRVVGHEFTVLYRHERGDAGVAR